MYTRRTLLLVIYGLTTVIVAGYLCIQDWHFVGQRKAPPSCRQTTSAQRWPLVVDRQLVHKDGRLSGIGDFVSFVYSSSRVCFDSSDSPVVDTAVSLLAFCGFYNCT